MLSVEAWPYCAAVTAFVSWLCASAYSAGMRVYVWRARQGEAADLPQSDGGNDPTTADLIWWGIADLVMLPSATCAPFKFPAAVSGDR